MRALVMVLVISFLLVSCATGKPAAETSKAPKPQEMPKTDEVLNMKITSKDFSQGEAIPKELTCQGANINPQLSIEDVPAEAKSLALILDDPDAPAGTWVHWLVKDIPAGVKEINQDSVPGNQVVNDFGKEDYGGPCPPSGTHRYFFRLYALDVESLDASGKREFYIAVEEHAIAKAELMGKYKKS